MLRPTNSDEERRRFSRDALILSLLAAAIILIIAAVVMVVLYGVTQPRAESELAVTEYEPRLIELDTMAVETAYRDYVHDLFKSWMKDPAGQPDRSRRGAIQARKAYIAAMDSIKRRKGQ